MLYKKVPNSKKEDKVREALGVEKRYEVSLHIPITGVVSLKRIAIMAVNNKAAAEKAIELALEGNTDLDDCEPEESDCDYQYESSLTWSADVHESPQNLNHVIRNCNK